MTIYDIAEKAGVSIATVSRVVNDKGGVGTATRRRVEAIMAECGYVPSAIARGMMSKTMRTVAILTVDVRVPHYARTAYIIERECTRLGYSVTVYNTGGVSETLKYLELLKQKHVDGVILVGSIHNELNAVPGLAKRLADTPVVVVNGSLEIPNACSVLMDDLAGMDLAVEHLYKKGHRQMIYLKDLDTDSARGKLSGFHRAMRARGLRPNVIEVESSLAGGMEGARRVLEDGHNCSAILCGEDLTAAGVLKEVRRAGLRVPQDMAITGYNNSIYARICEPELTTVDNRPESMALMSTQFLEQMLKGEKIPSVTLQPALVAGGST